MLSEPTTTELFEVFQALLEAGGANSDRSRSRELLRDIRVHQLDLEIQNHELLETQRQLAQSRLRYADLYDFSPVSYASLAADSTIEEINIAGGALLGNNPHQLIGTSFKQFIVPQHTERFGNHLRRCARSRRKRRVELRIRTVDGILRDIEVFTMATHDANRHTLQFRTAILDISKRKRAEEGLRQSRMQLEEKIVERTAELTESHNLLQAVIDKAQDWIYVKDRRGRYLMINEAGAAFLGLQSRSILGKTDEQLLNFNTADEAGAKIKSVMERGSSLTFESRIAPAVSPIERWFQTTAGPYRDRKGEIIGIVGIARDITERRRRDEAQRFLNEAGAVLSASLDYEITLHSLARAAIPYLADCCVVDMVQGDGGLARLAVAHSNADKEWLAWTLARFHDRNSVFGRSKVIRTGRPELYGSVTDSLIASVASDPEHLEILQRLSFKSFMCVPLIVRGETVGAVSFMLDRPDGHYRSFDLLVAEDLADRAAIAIDNAKLYMKEQAANRLKDDFLSRVSHELRTPLTPIFGAIYKLHAMRSENKELNEALEIIERNARQQAEIVEDLLDISRIANDQINFNRQASEMAPIIERAIEVVRPAAETLGIRLEADLETPKRPVWCDRERIQQVIWNILSNAIKFTPSGGTIRVQLLAKQDVVEIAITDSGVGIRSDFLPYVFDRFRQSDDFTTRMHGGLGLGLSIVRYIVERHGGVVRAESRGDGEGSTFVVSLPYS